MTVSQLTLLMNIHVVYNFHNKDIKKTFLCMILSTCETASLGYTYTGQC